jgi:Predicted ATPase (AAA+ superfamily)
MRIIGDSARLRITKNMSTSQGWLVPTLRSQVSVAGAEKVRQLLAEARGETVQEAELSLTLQMTPEGVDADQPIPEWPTEIDPAWSGDEPVLLFDMGLARRTYLPKPAGGKLVALLHDENIGLLKNVADKRDVVPVITMESLRKIGAPISRRLSWERTALDFRRDLAYGITREVLGGYEEWIVLLDSEGCLTLRDGTLYLYYEPARVEGDRPGMASRTSGLREAIAAGIASLMMENGHLSDLSLIFRFVYQAEGSLAKQPAKPMCPLACQAVPDITHVKQSGEWSIMDAFCEERDTDLYEIAREIVIHGEQSLLDQVPYCQFEALLTIDRQEIERYRAIVNLITEYRNNRDGRPLCIAVFGAPGSGKSFGIKQIAKQLGNFVTYTFNISQFTSLRELEFAFQEIRDASIRGKAMPLVFFDEFDSSLNGEPLGWLKYFLAPMQDGTFMEEGRERPLGRAVFVFAGGTSTSFEQFVNQDAQMFKKVKGPDFVSRLKGYINIQGPNPTTPQDKMFILRRALLLRSMILRGASQLVDADKRIRIDEDLLHALLTTKQYLHGSRSMEFLLAMSPLHHADKWTSSLLPPLEQMNLHVDAEDFYNQIYLLSMCNLMARNSHQHYLQEARQRGIPVSPDVNVDWEQLADTYQRSNRGQVRYHLERFRETNIGIRPITGDGDFRFRDEDLLVFAQNEHERWCRERRKDGWTYGPVRDNEKKLHPCLVDWDQLSDVEKQKDMDVILKIPHLLREIGFELYYRE